MTIALGSSGVKPLGNSCPALNGYNWTQATAYWALLMSPAYNLGVSPYSASILANWTANAPSTLLTSAP